MLKSTEHENIIRKYVNNCWHFIIYQHDKYNIWEFESMKSIYFFSILGFMSNWNFMLSWVEHATSFITVTAGPGNLGSFAPR